MMCCQFIFQPGTYDEEFLRLDAAIDEYARGLAGYVGVDRWERPELGQQNSIYYFKSMEAVRALSQFPDHLTAKAGVDRWYDGYQIVVSEITGTYGDGQIPHLLNGRDT